jgi:hypothetical protein
VLRKKGKKAKQKAEKAEKAQKKHHGLNFTSFLFFFHQKWSSSQEPPCLSQFISRSNRNNKQYGNFPNNPTFMDICSSVNSKRC